jgi:hypothetical protein
MNPSCMSASAFLENRKIKGCRIRQAPDFGGHVLSRIRVGGDAYHMCTTHGTDDMKGRRITGVRYEHW